MTKSQWEATHPEYEVVSIDAHQGRIQVAGIQVADTAGEVYTYHRADTVDVKR